MGEVGMVESKAFRLKSLFILTFSSYQSRFRTQSPLHWTLFFLNSLSVCFLPSGENVTLAKLSHFFSVQFPITRDLWNRLPSFIFPLVEIMLLQSQCLGILSKIRLAFGGRFPGSTIHFP